MSKWREHAGRGGCLCIGHRGAAKLAPQNTLRAFQRAIDLGVDAVELDVRWTRDRQLVVIHDEDVANSTNGQGFVRDCALADLLRLDAGEGERIPTLAEALDFIKGKSLIVLDLKLLDYEAEVVQMVKKVAVEADTLVCSLLPENLRRVRSLAPGLFTAISYPEDTGGASAKPYLSGAVSLALAAMRATMPWRISRMVRSAQADGTMLYHRLLTPAVVEAVHRQGWFIGAWTVDTEEGIARMRGMHVDSITSNRPDLLN